MGPTQIIKINNIELGAKNTGAYSANNGCMQSLLGRQI